MFTHQRCACACSRQFPPTVASRNPSRKNMQYEMHDLNCSFFQAKLPTVMSLSSVDEHQLWILSFLLCGVIAAVAIAGAAFFVIRRHSRTRQKLQNITQLDSEASKDYQVNIDLFRFCSSNGTDITILPGFMQSPNGYEIVAG